MRAEITYPFPKFNDAAIDIWEWKIMFISQCKSAMIINQRCVHALVFCTFNTDIWITTLFVVTYTFLCLPIVHIRWFLLTNIIFWYLKANERLAGIGWLLKSEYSPVVISQHLISWYHHHIIIYIKYEVAYLMSIPFYRCRIVTVYFNNHAVCLFFVIQWSDKGWFYPLQPGLH